MKKFFVLGCIVLFFISCQKKAETKDKKIDSSATKEKKSFEMYELSEMSLLMEQMYVANQRLKTRIEKGVIVGLFTKTF
jgi:hypothetical protein